MKIESPELPTSLRNADLPENWEPGAEPRTLITLEEGEGIGMQVKSKGHIEPWGILDIVKRDGELQVIVTSDRNLGDRKPYSECVFSCAYE